MKSLTRIVAGLAFSTVLALSLAASTSDALAASVPADAHGVAVERAPSGTTLTPFDALGITWD